MRSRFLRAVAAAVALTLALTACGGGDGDDEVVIPEEVSPELIPPSLAGGALSLSVDQTAGKAFGELPDNALVADGKLYSIREGDRLIATLQLSTLLPEVDLTDPDRYQEIADKLLPGVKTELSVADTPVLEFANEDKFVYIWFGRQMFEVLQIKGTNEKPEDILAEIIAFQTSSPVWEPLPPSEEEF